MPRMRLPRHAPQYHRCVLLTVASADDPATEERDPAEFASMDGGCRIHHSSRVDGMIDPNDEP